MYDFHHLAKRHNVKICFTLFILCPFLHPISLSCSVLSKLRHLNNETEEKKYSALIDCLCRWGQVGHLLELITDQLSEALPEKKKKKEKTRKVRIQDNMECKPDLALKYIEYLMTQNNNRDYLLAAQPNKLNNLFKQLALIKEVLCSFLKPSEGVTPILSQETSMRAFSLYCRLSIHLQCKFQSEGRTYLSLLEDTGTWVESQTYLTVCKDVIMIGLGDTDFQAQLLQTLISVIQTGKFFFFFCFLFFVL
ncbi:hypothetical protein AB205_0160600, partial [Aquarana catesbeiana]